MQPFGLWNFLQTALRPSEESADPPVNKGEDLAQENAPSPPPPPLPSQQEIAYQNFVNRHEQAASRIRKKS